MHTDSKEHSRMFTCVYCVNIQTVDEERKGEGERQRQAETGIQKQTDKRIYGKTNRQTETYKLKDADKQEANRTTGEPSHFRLALRGRGGTA